MGLNSNSLTSRIKIPDGPATSRGMPEVNLHRIRHPLANILVISPVHLFLWITLVAAGLAWGYCHYQIGPVSDGIKIVIAFVVGLPAFSWVTQQLFGTRVRFDRSTGKVRIYGLGHSGFTSADCPLEGIQFCKGRGFVPCDAETDSWNSFQINLIFEQNGDAIRYNILDCGDQDAMLKMAAEVASFMNVEFVCSKGAVQLDQKPPKRDKKKKAKETAKQPFPKLLLVMIAIPVLLVGFVFLNGKHLQRNATAAIEEVVKLGGKNDYLYSTTNELVPRFFNADFSGKPITDADLALLRPFFLEANGPRKLNLSGTRVTDDGLKHLVGFTFLHELILDDTEVTGSGLANLKSMGSDDEDELNVHISLAGSKANDAGLAGLAAIQYLGEVDLSRTLITGSGLAQLKSLNRLSTLKLTGCPIDDRGLDGVAALGSMNNLYDWDFSYTQITDAGLLKLMSLKHLRIVDLSGTKITDAGLPILNSRKELSSIWLDHTSITDTGLKAFAGNATLKGISLGGTAISEKGILQLKANNSLTYLNLNHSKTTDSVVRAMANWTTLETLNLECTEITNDGVAALADLPKLDRLYLKLSESKMTQEGIEALKRVKPKLSIDY